MDKIGPICRNSTDLGLVFDAIRGSDNKDLSVRNLPFNYNYKSKDAKKLRVAYLSDLLNEKSRSYQADKQVVELLKSEGITLVEKTFKSSVPMSAMLLILYAESGASFDELTRSNRDDLMVNQDQFAWPNTYRASRFIPAVEYINVNRFRSILIDEYNEFMKDIDVLIIPSFSSQLMITNLTGNPAVVVPNVDYSTGKSGSITFVGNHFDEESILILSRYYQELSNFHEIHPLDYK
jgi:Asp-tRNA(Asn)/Glu-tRNA(Gln) amidotransferase A subunit family amidase